MSIDEKHPVIKVPSEDSIIWKYMDLPSFIAFLQEKQLVFTRASLFEDKYEGTLPVFTKALTNYVFNEMHKKGELAESTDCGIFELAKYDSYINCWIKSDKELYHMWKIYSKESGVALKTTYGKIKQSFLNEDKEIIYPTEIKYLDFDKDDINICSNAMTSLTIKRKEYIAENEIRFIVSNPARCEKKYQKYIKENLKQDVHKSRIEYYEKIPIIKCKVDFEFIDEIKLSPYAPGWYSPLIKNLFEKYNLGTWRLSQSKL